MNACIINVWGYTEILPKIGTKVDPTGKQMYLIFPTILFDAYLVQAVNPNIARTQKLDRLLVVAFERKKR